MKPSETLLLRLRVEALRTNLEAGWDRFKELFKNETEVVDSAGDFIRKTNDFFSDFQRLFVYLPPGTEVESVTNAAVGQIDTLRRLVHFKRDFQKYRDIEENGWLASDVRRNLRDERHRVRELFQALPLGEKIDNKDWKSFRAASEKSNAVLAFCANLLGGIALADSRQDRGLGLIAEWIKDNLGFEMVPEQRRLNHADACAIYRKLPEWTVWALPLLAYDHWEGRLPPHDRDVYDPDVSAADRARYRPCLYDAYATFTMGPAYAYARIGLVLDPAGGRSFIDHARAETILTMLRRFDDSFGDLNMSSGTSKRLADAWDAARAQVGNGRGATGHDLAIARKLASRVWDKLMEDGELRTWSAGAWEAVKSLRTLLLRDRGAAPAAPLESEDLRMLLNAAWLVRVEDEALRYRINEHALKLAAAMAVKKPAVAPVEA